MQQKGKINLTAQGVGLGAGAGMIIGLLVLVVFFFAYLGEASAGRITDGYWVLLPILLCVPVVIILGLYGALVGAIGGNWVKKQFARTSGEELTRADQGAWARNGWLFGVVAGLVPVFLLALLSFGTFVQVFQQGIRLGSGFLAIQGVGLAIVLFSAIAARLYKRLLAAEQRSRTQKIPAVDKVEDRGPAN